MPIVEQAMHLACVLSNQFSGEERLRRDIEEALAGLDVVATGLSFPPMTEGYLWKLQQRSIDQSDLCIFLVGPEYGPISPTGVGYLHRAFAHALATRKPIVVLVYSDASHVVDAIDQRRRDGLLHEMRANAFVHDVQRGDEARSVVETFVDDLLSQDALPGWYRMDRLPSDNSHRVAELQAQVERLSQLLNEQRGAARMSDLASGKLEVNYRVKVFQDGNVTTIARTIGCTWQQVFALSAPLLTEPRREAEWKSKLEERLLATEIPSLRKLHSKAHSFVDLRMDGIIFDQIKRQFRQLDWVHNHQGMWSLSSVGEHQWLTSK